MRFAMSLGMLLCMTHGWISADHTAMAQQNGFEAVETVKSDTDLFSFGSQLFGDFPY